MALEKYRAGLVSRKPAGGAGGGDGAALMVAKDFMPNLGPLAKDDRVATGIDRLVEIAEDQLAEETFQIAPLGLGEY